MQCFQTFQVKFALNHITVMPLIISDGTINLNRVFEISGVFLKSKSEEVDLISDPEDDSS